MTNRFISFFEKVKSWFQRWFKSAPGVEHTIIATLTYVAPIVEGVLTLVDPPAAAIVTPVITIVQRDLATVAATVQDGMPAPGSAPAQAVISALNAINTNIAGLLNVAEVKNSAKIAEIEDAVHTITQEIDAVVGSVSGSLTA